MNKKELLFFLLTQVLKQHEGVRSQAYNDSLGHCTVGIGNLLHKGPCTPEEKKKKYTTAEINKLLEEDIEISYRDAVQWLGEESFNSLSLSWQLAIVAMSFQLGAKTLSLFSSTREAFLKRDVQLISWNLKRSKWAKQTPVRVEFILALLEHNSWRTK
jgi:lysozyme